MSDPRTDLPSDKAANFTARVRETLQTYMGRQGSQLDRGLTLRDLLDNGLVALKEGFNLSRPGRGGLHLLPGAKLEGAYTPDLTPPPTPTGFTANAAITHILLQTDAPSYQQGHGHLGVVVYGAIYNSGAAPVFNDALEITYFPGSLSSYPTTPATIWHLWAKWKTVDGVLSVSPAGGTNGLVVTTGQDVSLLLTALAGEITNSQLATNLNSRIDLIDGGLVVPALPKSLALLAADQTAVNQKITRDLSGIGTSLLDTVVTTHDTLKTVTDAGLYVDPATGLVKITTLEQTKDRLSTAEIAISAQTASINLKASTVYVDNAIATAVINPSQVPVFTALETRVNTAEVDISAANAAILLRATTAVSDAQGVRLTSAESNISSINGTLTDKVSTATYTAGIGNVTGRLGTAESSIAALGDTSSITQIVSQSKTRYTQDGQTAEALLRSILTGHADNEASLEGFATARRDLTAQFTDGFIAEASAREVLAGVVGQNAAALVDEKSLRVTADAAEAQARLAMGVQLGEAIVAAVSVENTARVSALAAEAQLRETLGTTVGANHSTLVNDYYTKTDANSAIATQASYLRSYVNKTAGANPWSFTGSTAPTVRPGATLVETGEVIPPSPLGFGDSWLDTSLNAEAVPKPKNTPMVWNGAVWVPSSDRSIAEADARITNVETTKIGYATLNATGATFDNGGTITNKAGVDAWNAANTGNQATWRVGLPLAQAVKQVTITVGGVTGTIEDRITAVATTANSMYLEKAVRIGSDNSVVGYGLSGHVSGGEPVVTDSKFIANVDAFAVTIPTSSIPNTWATNTAYATNAVVKVAGVNDRQLVCTHGGTSGATVPPLSILPIGNVVTDGSVTWQVASRVPFSVCGIGFTTVNGQVIPNGTFIDGAYVQNLTASRIVTGTLGADVVYAGVIDAGQITTGSIDVNTTLSSTANYGGGGKMWSINGAGLATFNNAVVRGEINATSGVFKGSLLGGSAANYASGIGLYSGWDGVATDTNYRWRVGTPGGARIQWTGSAVEVYNASNILTLSSGGVDWAAVGGKPAFAPSNATANQTDAVTNQAISAAATTANWTGITKDGNPPADGATVNNGAFANLVGPITPTNAGNFLSNAIITNAMIAGDVYSDTWGPSNGTNGWYLQRNGTLYCANAYVRGDVRASTLYVGTSPAVSGSSMTGSGGVVNSTGTFALGNSTSNISFDGANVTINSPHFANFSAALSGSLATSVGLGAAGIGTLLATPSGGRSPYLFVWAVTGLQISLSAAGGSCSVTSIGDGTTNSGKIFCVVSDVNGRTTICEIAYSVSHASAGA